MLCLHLGWWQNQAILWGEKQFSELQPPKTRGRQPRNPPPKKHPYGVEAEELALALSLPSLVPDDNRAEKALAYLPTANSLPLASDPLIAPNESEEAVIAPWEIPVITLTDAQTMALIGQYKGKRLLAPGVLGGYEFPYLADLAHFALSLIIRESFLPTLIHQESYLAGWEAVLLGSDQAHYCEFIKTFPEVCRSIILSRKQGMQPSSPEEVVTAWLNQMITSFVKEQDEKKHPPPTPHDAWIWSLEHPQPLTLEAGEKLMEQVKEWKRPLQILLSAPFRLCFRLEEPEHGETDLIQGELQFQKEGWRVHYLLQDQSDPSLLVEVQEFWNPKGAKRKVLERENLNPRQFTLTLLGMASSLSPQIEESLQEEIPKGFALDMEGAYQFLTEQAPKLRDAGYGVILPSWWTNRGAKLKTRAVVSSPMRYARKRSLWDEVSVDWKVALAGCDLSLEELQALADLKAPLVKVRGKWVEVNPLEIQKAIAFWKKQTEAKTTLSNLVKYSFGGQEIEARGWVKTFFDHLENPTSLTPLPTPQGFEGTLRPYQVKGLSWLVFLRQWGLGGCLADDMGLGKTPQTLASLMHDREVEGVTKPSLLICPTSLIANWEKETKRFTPHLAVMIHHGPERLRGEAFKKEVDKGPLVISSYALLLRDLSDFKEIDWDGVILDEAQNIKNPAAKQSRSAFTLNSRYRLALSGTPVENHIGDLWSMMHFANPHFLGTQASFKKTFFAPIQYQKDPEAITRLKQMTAPFILRRTKTDPSIVDDLPEKNEIKTYTSLTKEQASLYTSVIQDAEATLETAEGIDRRGVILATLMKLKQVCNHPAQFTKEGTARLANRSEKLERLSQMLAEIKENEEHSLIFTQYTAMGEMLKSHLENTFGEEALFLHGQLSKKKRDQMIEHFQEGNVSTFILSLKAGGTGLNLTQANNVFHFDRWWNPAIENQATDRVFRIGQKKRVSVYKFITSGTVEERIDEMIEQKKSLSSSVITEGENYLTELSTDELKELWKLRSAYCED